MPDVHCNLKSATTKEAANHSPSGALRTFHESCSWIETFALSNRMSLDVVTQNKEWRHRICQIQQHGRGYNADKSEVVGDGCCNDECYNPPDWNDSSIEEFATGGGEWRRVEDIYEDIVVEDFDTDVAVKARSNQAGDQSDHVTSSLPAIGTDPHVAGGEAVLALKVINVGSVDEINAVDEELCSPHGFNEVSRPPHLS